jgi:hypothetical protein
MSTSPKASSRCCVQHARTGRRSSPPTRIRWPTSSRLSDGPHALPSTERLAPLVDRFELFNRETLFGWVAEAGLPTVANGDFHRLEHLGGWKTLLPCAKDEEAVVDYLCSPRPSYLVRLDARPQLRAA